MHIRAAAACLLVAGLLASAGCKGSGDEDDAPPRERPLAPLSEGPAPAGPQLETVPADSLAERPATLRDTIMIEGMPELATATLLRAPPGFALPISTYVPDGMEVELQSSDGGAGITITASFTAASDPNAYMHLHMYPPGTSLHEARNAVGGFMRSRVLQDDPTEWAEREDVWRPVAAPGWALEAYSFTYDWNPDTRYIGRITIGRHGPRFFHVLTHYPPEYGDGLGPRFTRILDLWRWEDTGRMLTRPGL